MGKYDTIMACNWKPLSVVFASLLFAVTNSGGISFPFFRIVSASVSGSFSSFLPSSRLVKKLSYTIFCRFSWKVLRDTSQPYSQGYCFVVLVVLSTFQPKFFDWLNFSIQPMKKLSLFRQKNFYYFCSLPDRELKRAT